MPMNTIQGPYTKAAVLEAASPREISPIEQMLAELETQTRCMDNAIGLLEDSLVSVLGPVPPRPADAQTPQNASGYSQLRDRLKAFVEIVQSQTSRINSIRERVEC